MTQTTASTAALAGAAAEGRAGYSEVPCRRLLSRAGRADPGTLAGKRRLPPFHERAGGRPRIRLLRRPSDRKRPARHPPCPRARLQGHVPSLQDNAGLSRIAQGRLGHPRPARRTRSRKAARPHRQRADRTVRRRQLQSDVPRIGLGIPQRLGGPHRANGLLGQP